MNTNTDSPLPKGKKSVVIAPPTQKRRRPLHFEPLFLIPYLLSAAVALFWPEEGWRNSFVDTVADFFVNHIPSVNAYVRKSVYPEVMRAYFALTFFIFLPTAWLLSGDKDSLFKEGFDHQLKTIKEFKFPKWTTFMLLLYCLCLVYILYIQNGYQFNLFPILEKRWALAIIGPTVSWMTYFVLLIGSFRQLQFYLKLINKEK